MKARGEMVPFSLGFWEMLRNKVWRAEKRVGARTGAGAATAGVLVVGRGSVPWDVDCFRSGRHLWGTRGDVTLPVAGGMTGEAA